MSWNEKKSIWRHQIIFTMETMKKWIKLKTVEEVEEDIGK